MGDPLSVVILVAAGGAAEPTTLAIERATNEALGRSARVVVRESAGAPTDGEALAASTEAGEDAAVEVTWADAGHRLVMLRVHLAGRARWLDRTIGFGASDADGERGRTIGFALASMLPEAAGGASDAPAPAFPAPALAPPSPPAPELDESRGPVGRELRYALDLVGIGAAGGAGEMQGGAGGALETFVSSRLSIRVGGAVRAGPVEGARAWTLTLRGAAGLAVRPWGDTASHGFAMALRADYVVESQSVTHYAPDGPDVSTRSRLLSGLDALIDAEWRLARNADALVGVGIEEIFGTTYIDLNGARVATLPPFRAVAETGLRVRF
jgi:hypothetical protein